MSCAKANMFVFSNSIGNESLKKNEIEEIIAQASNLCGKYYALCSYRNFR